MLQTRSPIEKRSQVVAANNIMNALFMTIASLFAIVILKMGLTIPQLFLVTSVLNAIIVLCIFRAHPEFITRFKLWLTAFRK